MKTLSLKTHNNANVQSKLLAKFLSNKSVEVFFEAEENDFAPDFENEADIRRINNEYNSGNIYAWFCAKVTVKYRGFEADDYLGGCSYESEKDFKENSGYYADMILSCIEQINKDIIYHNNEVCRQFKTRRLKIQADLLGFLLIPKTAVL